MVQAQYKRHKTHIFSLFFFVCVYSLRQCNLFNSSSLEPFNNFFFIFFFVIIIIVLVPKTRLQCCCIHSFIHLFEKPTPIICVLYTHLPLTEWLMRILFLVCFFFLSLSLFRSFLHQNRTNDIIILPTAIIIIMAVIALVLLVFFFILDCWYVYLKGAFEMHLLHFVYVC